MSDDFQFRVTGARGAIYECSTMHEAEKLAGVHGTISTRNMGRYERETGDKGYLANSVEQYVVDDDTLPTHAFSMTKVNKLGINTKTSYQTPAGIYFYPLNETFYNQLLEDGLPFVSSAPYVQLVELMGDAEDWLIFKGTPIIADLVSGAHEGVDNQSPERVLEVAKILSEYVIGLDHKQGPGSNHELWQLQGKLQKEIKLWKLYRKRAEENGTFFPDSHPLLNAMRKSGFEKPLGSTDVDIWAMTWYVTQVLTSRDTRKNEAAIVWSRLMRLIGIIGALDMGYGVIHPSEPTQAVAFTPKAYRLIDSFKTSQLRRAGRKGEPTTYDKMNLAGTLSSPRRLMELALDPDTAVQAMVALNNNAPAEVLDSLSFSNSPSILSTVAGNPNTSAKTLDRLSRHPALAVRKEVAMHPNTSEATIIEMLEVPSRRRGIVDTVLGRKHFTQTLVDALLDMRLARAYVVLMRHNRLSTNQLLQLAHENQPTFSIYEGIAWNTRASNEVLQALLNNPDARGLDRTMPLVRAIALSDELLRQISTSPETLRMAFQALRHDVISRTYSIPGKKDFSTLRKLTNRQTKELLVTFDRLNNNPNTPPDVLADIAELYMAYSLEDK